VALKVVRLGREKGEEERVWLGENLVISVSQEMLSYGPPRQYWMI
jgi:hypothetical protein